MKKLFLYVQVIGLLFSFNVVFNHAYAGKVDDSHSASAEFDDLNTDLKSLVGTATAPLVWIGFLGSIILFAFKPNVGTVVPPIALGLYGSFGPEIVEATFSALTIF